MRARIVSDRDVERQRRIVELGTGFPESFPRFYLYQEPQGLKADVTQTYRRHKCLLHPVVGDSFAGDYFQVFGSPSKI